MAPPPEERREDSVALPRSTVKIVTGVLSSLILGVGLVLWNLVLDNVRINEQLKQLDAFGPKAGDRFTAKEGTELKRWILDMQRSFNTHKGLGEHPFARRRLDTLEKCCEQIEDRCNRNGD